MTVVSPYAAPGIRREPKITFEITADNIKNLICEKTGVPWDIIISKLRSDTQVGARYMICHFVYKYVGLNKSEIARLINKDHVTVIRALRVYENEYKTSDTFRALCDKITLIIESK